MTDFSKILEKAKEVEAKMKESQEKIKQIEVIGISGGDLVNVSGTGKNLGTGETITVTDQAGTVVSGDNFKLTGVSYSGGDTGGGNASVTFSYSTFNSFTATNQSA